MFAIVSFSILLQHYHNQWPFIRSLYPAIHHTKSFSAKAVGVFYITTMSSGNNGENYESASRKRKMKQPLQVGESSSPPNPNLNPFTGAPQTIPIRVLSPNQDQIMASALGINNNNNNVQNNHAAQVTRPFSYMELLTSVEDIIEDPYPPEPNPEINRAILSYNIKLRQWAEDQQQKAEERATTRLREIEHELHRKTLQYDNLTSLTEYFRNKAERLQRRVTYFEQLADDLRGNLAHIAELRRQARIPEVGESSNQQGVRVECRVCDTATAVVMMLPCRHVSACKRCDETADKCPVCNETKASSVFIN